MPNQISAKYLRPIQFLLQNISILIGILQLSSNFIEKMIYLKEEFSKLLLDSDGCCVFNLIPYCIILRYSAPLYN